MNRTLIEKFFDSIISTAYAPGLSYVKVVADEAFYPTEIKNALDWTKYNVVLPIEQMTEEDWSNLWSATAERYDKYVNQGGVYNTINFWGSGIPEAVVTLLKINGHNGKIAWNDPSLYNYANYLTMGLVDQFNKAANTPMSDPEYWRAMRTLLTTEATAIGIYNALASGSALPTTTEELIKWGDKYSKTPSGTVPAGTFDEAFDYDNIWDMPKGGEVINGRKYSQHALERMAPDTPEVRAEQYARATKLAQDRGLQPGTPEYSTFVDKYVDPRGIPPSVVEDAIANGTQTPGNTPNTFVYDTSDIRVVVNENGDVITVIPK